MYIRKETHNSGIGLKMAHAIHASAHKHVACCCRFLQCISGTLKYPDLNFKGIHICMYTDDSVRFSRHALNVSCSYGAKKVKSIHMHVYACNVLYGSNNIKNLYIPAPYRDLSAWMGFNQSD